MKIECLKDKFSWAITRSEKVTGKNMTLPVLSCLLLEASKNNLVIKATNLDLGIEINIPVKTEKEGVVAVPGNVLSNFISNINGDKNVKMEFVDGNLLINTGSTSTTIKSYPHEDFPTIPKISEEKSFKINSLEFSKGLKSVWYSSAISSMKPELSSIYIYQDDSSGDIVFVATDSFRLAEKRIKTKKPLKDFNQILIPFKNVAEIIRILDDVKDEVLVCLDKNQISFSHENIYLTSRVIDGVFPDYKQIIPKEFKTEVILLKQDLLNSLKVANIFSDNFNQINIKVSPQTKTFELMTKNSNVGENINKMEAVITGEEVAINFNYKYIVDCFQSIDSDSVSLNFNGLNRPVVIRGVSDKSFMYLVMPMNK